MSFLAEVTAARRSDADARRASLPDLRARAADLPPPSSFPTALSEPGLSLIAEFKRASPSVGSIREGLDPGERARAYEAGGARAMSVLTEPTWFKGDLGDLEMAADACALPILRKDFLSTELHLLEARVAGASAVLLIVAALEPAELIDLHATALQLGLAALVEVHDEDEVASAMAAGATIIGVNTRNLATLEVDPHQVARVRPSIPDGVIVVGESGIKTRADVEAMEAADVDAILVGEALMRAEDVAVAVRDLLGQR